MIERLAQPREVGQRRRRQLAALVLGREQIRDDVAGALQEARPAARPSRPRPAAPATRPRGRRAAPLRRSRGGPRRRRPRRSGSAARSGRRRVRSSGSSGAATKQVSRPVPSKLHAASACGASPAPDRAAADEALAVADAQPAAVSSSRSGAALWPRCAAAAGRRGSAACRRPRARTADRRTRSAAARERVAVEIGLEQEPRRHRRGVRQELAHHRNRQRSSARQHAADQVRDLAELVHAALAQLLDVARAQVELAHRAQDALPCSSAPFSNTSLMSGILQRREAKAFGMVLDPHADRRRAARRP